VRRASLESAPCSGSDGRYATACRRAARSVDDLDLHRGRHRVDRGWARFGRGRRRRLRLVSPVPARQRGSTSGRRWAERRSDGVDVLVDYTSATVVKANVLAAVEAGAGVVVGSSGLTAEDFAEIDAPAREHSIGVVASGCSLTTR
jgi:dihydrodipicolinate reductase